MKGDPKAENDAPAGPPARGTLLDHFVVLDPIGSGGMGMVLAAYDPDLDRKVALKLLRADAFGEGAARARARLVREAQALAKLSHHNVVTVYEVGTVGEQVFVAMEFVEGTTLRAYLAAAPRSTREVVAMFARAGRGLAAAHAAGLVHRDFKPENVLVGADGRVRVTDFGLVGFADRPEPALVPAVEAPVLDRFGQTPTLTRTGSLLGTPAYMAPEQHEGQPADARADQFAFCVALYEGLCGERPFAGETYRELCANVLAGRVREVRAALPASLRRLVLRGLSVDPAARFPSMDALLAELDRDPGPRRLRALIAAGALAAVAAGGAVLWRVADRGSQVCRGAERKLTGAWDEAVQDRVRAAFLATGKPYAAAAWTGAAARLDDYARAWVSWHGEACRATRVHGEQSEEALDLRMTCLDRRLGELRALTALFARADAEVVESAVPAARSLPDLAVCADLGRLAAPSPLPADPAARARIDAVRAALAGARAEYRAGKYQEALGRAEPALAAARATGHGALEAEALLLVGELSDSAGDAKAAEPMLVAAALAAEAAHDDEVVADARLRLVRVIGVGLARHDEGLRWGQFAGASIARLGDQARQVNLENAVGAVLYHQGRYDDAEEHQERALALGEQALGVDHPDLAAIHHNLGNVQYKRGRYDAALGHHRRALAIKVRALGPDHPSVAFSHNAIGSALTKQGKYAEAVVQFERSLAVREAALGPDHPDVAYTCNNLGTVLVQQGEHARAAAQFSRALAIKEKALGPDHPDVASSLNNRASVELHQGDYAAAAADYRRALAIKEKALGPDHADLASTLSNLGSVYLEQGQYAAALAHHRRALAIQERALGRDHPDVGVTLNNLGMVLAAQGQWDAAIEHYELALAIWRRKLGDGDPLAAHALTGLGAAHLGRGQPELALAPLERALALREAGEGDPLELARTRAALARALWHQRAARPRARELARRARADLAAAGAPGAREHAAVEAWLAERGGD